MIIKSFELQKKIDQNINFYLLYGKNSGLIEECVENILKPVFSKNIYNFEEQEIIKKSDEFNELIYNESFFDDEKLIIINRATEKIYEIVNELLESKIDKIKIIIKANILEKRSKLRNLFEKNKEAIVVACYEDNYQSLLNLTINFLNKEKIKISKESINELILKSMGDRINLQNELEKILIFSHKHKSIDANTISKLTNRANEENNSEIIDCCLSKNRNKLIRLLIESNLSNENILTIIKLFLIKLKRLKKIKTELETNTNIESILSSYKPPIFWKEKDLIKKHLNIWNLKTIKSLILEINNLELKAKKYPYIAGYLVYNCIFDYV